MNHRRWQRGVSRRTGCARVCVYVLVRGVHVPILCDVFGRRSLFITPFAILPWCYYQQRVTDGALPRAAQARSVPEPVARSIKLVHLSLCELAGRAEFERAHREIWAHLSICMLGAHTRPDKLVGGHQASSMHLPRSRTDLYRPRTDLYRPGRNSMPPVRMLCSVTKQEVAALDLRQ